MTNISDAQQVRELEIVRERDKRKVRVVRKIREVSISSSLLLGQHDSSTYSWKEANGVPVINDEQ